MNPPDVAGDDASQDSRLARHRSPHTSPCRVWRRAPYNGAIAMSKGVSLPEIWSQRERNAHTCAETLDSHSALFTCVRERRTLGLARSRRAGHCRSRVTGSEHGGARMARQARRTALGDRRGAARRQRPARQRRRGVPAGGIRARRPTRPDARRRDRAPVRLDRVAVPGAQLPARVRGVPARRRLAPCAAPAARPRRRVGRHAALRAARLRAGGDLARTGSSPAASATA